MSPKLKNGIPESSSQDSEYAKMILEIVPLVMWNMRTQMRVLAKPKMTIPQFRTLARLNRSAATNSELAEWMGLSAPTMTRMVDLLVQRRLVIRTQQKEDRRQMTLSLTGSGQKLFFRIYNQVQEKLATNVASLDEEKKQDLKKGLRVLGELFL